MRKNSQVLGQISDVNTLADILVRVLETAGFVKVKKVEQYVIEGEELGALRAVKHKFIVTLSELSGKVDLIRDLSKKHKSDEYDITVLTSHSKKISKYFKEWISKETGNNKISFWDQDEMIRLIDRYIPDFWGHNDLFQKAFEDRFIKQVSEEFELRKILNLDKKYENLLNVFIKPKIYLSKEDEDSGRTVKVKIPVESFLRRENFIISGDAGTGKSVLLKEVGKMQIEANAKKGLKILPVLVRPSDIQKSEYSFSETIEYLLRTEYGVGDTFELIKTYSLMLLIDSIDEFEVEVRKRLLGELATIVKDGSVTFLLCTRSYENLVKNCTFPEHHQASLSNFDQKQVKQYLDNFFKFDLAKSDSLWENLQENNILDRIPVTPLTISLVSILYEERRYEIPATITDVFDNFNIFLLGRMTIRENLEFLDINIKERVLSAYALDIIRNANRQRKTKQEFVDYVKNFFAERSITVNEELIPELFNSLTEHTGILFTDDNDLVTFKHDHFMEYYASREIFSKRNREEIEKELIDKFTEYNWQNTAIFYGGRTKDMPEFLRLLVDRVRLYSQLNDCLLAISGLGYVLQSLWLTDSQVRKDAVLCALDLVLRADAKVKDLSSVKANFFENINNVDVAFLNLFWFYNHYNSITLRDPLNLAFDEIFNETAKMKGSLFQADRISRLYQLFCIAATLDTGRNSDSTKMSLLFDTQDILTNAFFVFLFEEGSNMLELKDGNRLKKLNGMEGRLRKYRKAISFYLQTSSDDLRFTKFDQLTPIKNVHLFTEGKTDAMIISHAFNVVCPRKESYWNVSSMDKVKLEAGGANELRKYLEELGREISSPGDAKKVVIGIFDNDAKGYQEFNGMHADFTLVRPGLKKHVRLQVFALLLPIPDSEAYASYVQKKQEFKFFEIEHYFPLEYLMKHGMVKETPIPGVFEVSGNKTKFAEEVNKDFDEETFKLFPIFFNAIDEICNERLIYID